MTKKTGIFAAILLSAHLVLLLAIFFLQTDFHTPDSFRYLLLAESLEGGRYGLETVRGFESESLRLPGYPFFIFVCQGLFGDSAYSVVIVQMVLHLLSVFLIYRTVEENFGVDAGLVFLALGLLFPSAAFSSVYILPETPSLLLISAGIFVLSKESNGARIWNFCLAGVCFGLAAYMRTNLFLTGFVVAFALFLFFPRFRRPALAMAGIVILVSAPWLVRNYVSFGSLSGRNVGFETIIYQSTISAKMAAANQNLFRRSAVPTRYEDYENQEIREQIVYLKDELGLPHDAPYHDIVFDLSPEQTYAAKNLIRDKAVENISDAPFYFLTQAVGNAARMWIAAPDLKPERFPVLPQVLSLVVGVLTLIFAVAGALFSVTSGKADVRFVGLIFVSVVLFFTISLSFLHLEIRYTVPAGLLFLALASYGIVAVVRAFRSR